MIPAIHEGNYIIKSILKTTRINPWSTGNLFTDEGKKYRGKCGMAAAITRSRMKMESGI